MLYIFPKVFLWEYGCFIICINQRYIFRVRCGKMKCMPSVCWEVDVIHGTTAECWAKDGGERCSHPWHRYKTSCHLFRRSYLLTPWSRVFLEKLTGSAASQEIPHIFGTRRFITVLTSARQQSLSWANSIQSPKPPPTSWRSILILSSHLRLGFPNGLFPHQNPVHPSPLPHTRHMPRPSHSSRFYHPHNIR